MGHYLFNFTRRNAEKGRPLRNQAAELAALKLWGIGEDAPNRGSLLAGDRVLLYVGAPEKEFIGQAVLASGAHPWTSDEGSCYPGGMTSGVAFSEVDLWEHPLSLQAAMPGLDLEKTNPKALFFSGVTKVTQHDFQAIVAAGAGAAPAPEPSPLKTAIASGSPPSPVDGDLLFKTAERLKRVDKASSLGELDTRAQFIDKYLEALGYTEFGDVQREAVVDSGAYPDYVLIVNDKRMVAIEAKRLGAQLGPKEAGQVASYCTNLGLRWGAVTDGRIFKLYDMAVIGALPEERLVFSVDLSDYRDQDDFETRIYPALALIAKTELASGGTQLERRVALEAVRELMSSSSSKTIRTLRKELDDTRKIRLSTGELSELASDLFG
jgi:hypothetical protein